MPMYLKGRRKKKEEREEYDSYRFRCGNEKQEGTNCGEKKRRNVGYMEQRQKAWKM